MNPSAWGLRVILNELPRRSAWALFGPDGKPAELEEQEAKDMAEIVNRKADGIASYFAASFAAVARLSVRQRAAS